MKRIPARILARIAARTAARIAARIAARLPAAAAGCCLLPLAVAEFNAARDELNNHNIIRELERELANGFATGSAGVLNTDAITLPEKSIKLATELGPKTAQAQASGAKAKPAPAPATKPSVPKQFHEAAIQDRKTRRQD